MEEKKRTRRTLKEVKDKSLKVRITTKKYNEVVELCNELDISISDFLSKAISDKVWEFKGE